MGQIFFVVWRESVEALLVVGILYAWLKNGDAAARRGLPYLWAGVAAGLVAAVALGAVLVGVSEVLSGVALDAFQAAMVLVAAVLIVQMVLWMKRHGRTLKRDMEQVLVEHTRNERHWGIALLVALAIAREGSETAIFLYGLGFGQNGRVTPGMYGGVFGGLALAFLTFYVLQLGGRLFSWRRFFRCTEILLLLLAAGLLENGVDKLIDMGWLPPLLDPLWNSAALLDDGSTVGAFIATLTGYRAHPSLLNVLAYAAFWALVWLLTRRANRVAQMPQGGAAPRAAGRALERP
jgi:high-affinity iron transporter